MVEKMLFEDSLVCHYPPSTRISPSNDSLPPPCRSTAGMRALSARFCLVEVRNHARISRTHATPWNGWLCQMCMVIDRQRPWSTGSAGTVGADGPRCGKWGDDSRFVWAIFDTIPINTGSQPRDPPFFSKSDWVFELFCVTRIAHFYVRATAGLQCAEARESSFATIPVLSRWTAFWARTILSKFDFPQTSPITRKCFSQAFPATFYSVNRHITKKLKRLDSWKLSWASLREMGRWSVSAASSCVLSKNGIFPSWTTTSGVDFRATWPTPTRLLSGSDFSEDWKQVGTEGTLGHC